MTPTLDEHRVEAVADTLRRLEQGGKRLNDWKNLPKATKRKWCDKVTAAITAYLGGEAPSDDLRKFVVGHWDNQDMNHEDFRVRAYQIAAAEMEG